MNNNFREVGKNESAIAVNGMVMGTTSNIETMEDWMRMMPNIYDKDLLDFDCEEKPMETAEILFDEVLEETEAMRAYWGTKAERRAYVGRRRKAIYLHKCKLRENALIATKNSRKRMEEDCHDTAKRNGKRVKDRTFTSERASMLNKRARKMQLIAG